MLIVPEEQLVSVDKLDPGKGWWGPICVCGSGLTFRQRYLAASAERDDLYLFDMLDTEMGLLARMREVVLSSRRHLTMPSDKPLICSTRPIQDIGSRRLLKTKPYEVVLKQDRKHDYLAIGHGITQNPLFITFLSNMASGMPDSEFGSVLGVIQTHLIPAKKTYGF